jgi:hypothetical protein
MMVLFFSVWFMHDRLPICPLPTAGGMASFSEIHVFSGKVREAARPARSVSEKQMKMENSVNPPKFHQLPFASP